MGRLSPDERWIAFQTADSGEPQVFVQSSDPGVEGQWQVSSGGGGQPRWSNDGRELYYRTDTGVSMVAIDADASSFRPGEPTSLFEGNFAGGPTGIHIGTVAMDDWDAAPDGQHFFMIRWAYPVPPGPQLMTLMLNWSSALRRLAPAER